MISASIHTDLQIIPRESALFSRGCKLTSLGVVPLSTPSQPLPRGARSPASVNLPRYPDMQLHKDIVNPKMVYRYLHNRALSHPWWNPHVHCVLRLDHALALTGKAHRVPVTPRSTTDGTAHKHGNSKRHHDAVQGFIGGEPYFDRQVGELHRFCRLMSRKILRRWSESASKEGLNGAKVREKRHGLCTRGSG